jgi:hypothetical protein
MFASDWRSGLPDASRGSATPLESLRMAAMRTPPKWMKFLSYWHYGTA